MHFLTVYAVHSVALLKIRTTKKAAKQTPRANLPPSVGFRPIPTLSTVAMPMGEQACAYRECSRDAYAFWVSPTRYNVNNVTAHTQVLLDNIVLNVLSTVSDRL